MGDQCDVEMANIVTAMPPQEPAGTEGATNGPAPKPPNYRPWVMSTWALCLFCILPLVSIGMIEYVHQTSRKDRGLFRTGPKYETREKVSQFVPMVLGNFILIFSGLFLLDLDIRVKKMEPFYHMSKPKGATGSVSLCVDYFRPPIFFIPYIAIRNRHWTVLCTSSALILDTVVLLHLVWRSFGYGYDNQLEMVLPYKYALQAVLLLISMLMGVLAIILHKRNSGVLYNPKDFESLIRFTSISSSQNSIYSVFKKLHINDEISEDELEKILGPLRFQLQPKNLGTEKPRFDIVLNEEDLPLLEDINTQQTPSTTNPSAWTKVCCWYSEMKRIRRRWLWKDNHPWLFQKIPLSIFLFIHISLFVLLTGQPFWSRNPRFPQSYGIWFEKGVQVAFSFLQASFWMQLKRYSGEYENIYLMCRSQGAPYDKMSSRYMMWPIEDIVRAIISIRRNGWGDVSSYVDLATSLGLYVPPIFLTAWLLLPYDINNNWTSSIIYISIMIPCEVTMVWIMLIMFYYRSRPFLPRQPLTLASKLVMVYATDIIKADYDPLASTKSLGEDRKTISAEAEEVPQRRWNFLSGKKKDKKKTGRVWLDFVEDDDPRICAFGNFTGRDGEPHVGIGKYGAGMTAYTLSKQQQQKIDQENTYEPISITEATKV